MTRKILKPLKIALFGFIVSLILCFCVGAVGVASNNDFSDGYYSTSVDISTVSIPYDFSDGTYNIQYLYFYMGDLNGDLFIIDNQLNFYYDILPLYNDIGSLLNDSEIYYYWTEKYPYADLNDLYWLLGGNSTYLSDIFYSIKSDFYNIENLSYNNGITEGYANGFTEGYANGITEGYSNGFTEGTYNGMQESEALKGGLLTILSAPFYVLGGILDFDILGINLLDIFTGLLTLCLFAFVVKKLINGGA